MRGRSAIFGSAAILLFASTLPTPLVSTGVPSRGSGAPDLTLSLLVTLEANQASAHLGYSAAACGDVNGDGFTDLILGQRDYDGGQQNEGRILVHRGGPAGVETVASWTFESNQAIAFLGASVASAGDVNGDGFHDVIAGAPSYDDGQSNEGVAYLFMGSASGLGAAPAWTKGGDQETAAFGTSVACAGDVNGDGRADVIIGARGADGAFDDEGRASVFYGTAAGLATSPAWSVTGAQDDPGFGGSVAGAGDVNGDGYADVIVGAFLHDAGEMNEGAAFAYLGSAGGLATASSWMGQGNQSNASYGWSVAGAGDVNADGYADVLVGARDHQTTLLKEGKAFAYLGGAGGIAPFPIWSAVGGDENASFGWSVASAGDVNGDGLADALVGAPRADPTWLDAGEVRLFLGARAGGLVGPAWSDAGASAGAQLGWCVASAGDVNGDGFGDVLLSCPYDDNGQTDEGRVRVWAGAVRLPAAAPAWRASGGATSAAYGQSLAFLGDVNGDGFDDLAVGDPFHSNGQTAEGRVDVFYGASNGFAVIPSWSVESNQASAFLGWSVARTGDVNGDGYDDLVIGAPNWDGAQPNEGRATLHWGSAAGLAPAPAWTRTGGQNGASFGFAVAGGGDADGDGFADIVIGAPFQDGAFLDAGAIHWFRGGIGGPTPLPQRMIVGMHAGQELGAAIAHAGDADGDGRSDVIAGAPGFSNGDAGEGAAFFARGTSSGLAPAFTWSAEGGQAESRFGGSVAFAGDVNGDGFAEVLASARLFDGGAEDEGRALLYMGTTTGPSPTASWSYEGNQVFAELDACASAGDVNGDGRADVFVGAGAATSGSPQDGVVSLFHGEPGGLGALPAWSAAGPAAFAAFGSSLGGAGDADGDGFADLAIGARALSDSAGTGGAALVCPGNGAFGAARALRSWRVLADAPIPRGGASDAADRFRVRAIGRTPVGRGRVRLAIEARLAGAPPGAPTIVTGAWAATGPPSLDGSTALLEETVAGFFAGARIVWRARILGPSPIFPGTPWGTPSASARGDHELRTDASGPSDAPSGIAPPVHDGQLRVVGCRPHPARSRTSIEVMVARAGHVRVRLVDVRGRHVRTIHEGPLASGTHVLPFDVADDAEHPLAAGVYFALAVAGDRSASRRIVVVR